MQETIVKMEVKKKFRHSSAIEAKYYIEMRKTIQLFTVEMSKPCQVCLEFDMLVGED